MPTRRPNIFIASSKEALPIARAVKANFDNEADVDIWSEDIFKANRNYLDTLLNRASYYDFFIAVFTPDDEAKIREQVVRVTRDNVIFEFGLFLGRLGPDRSFLVVQEGVEMFSDWSGIETAKFHIRDNLVAAVGGACNRIRQEMEVAERLQHFTMLPSTPLAIGYYNNFLKRVFEAFEFSNELQIIERDSHGNETSRTTHRITNQRPTIHVMLPSKLGDLESTALKRRTVAYKQISVSTQHRAFPFYIQGDIGSDADNVTLFDVPTTMLSSKIAIEHIFSDEFLARENTRQHLESREIANFERTLRIMVPEQIEADSFKFSVLV